MKYAQPTSIEWWLGIRLVTQKIGVTEITENKLNASFLTAFMIDRRISFDSEIGPGKRFIGSFRVINSQINQVETKSEILKQDSFIQNQQKQRPSDANTKVN